MATHILATLVLLLASAIALQDGTTQDCNYVLDVWFLTENPPSPAPTAAPTEDPTESPTREPTEVNATTSTWDRDSNINANEESMSYSSGKDIAMLLNPYRIEECYTMNFTSEPYNEVAWKYECRDSSTLVREIWWDSLECSGDGATTTIEANERGYATQFVCNADRDCSTVDIEVVAAITQSPTPEPTEEPTPVPTAFTGNMSSSCALREMYHNYGCYDYDDRETGNFACQCDDYCMDRSPSDCCDDFEEACSETEHNDVIRAESGSNGDSGEFMQCDNTEGPVSGAENIFEWKYAANICVHMYDFYGIFVGVEDGNENKDISEFNFTEIRSVGWYCEGDSYYLALYEGADCDRIPQKFVQYTNDECAFGGGAWAYVECSPTPSPTPAFGDGVERQSVMVAMVFAVAFMGFV